MKCPNCGEECVREEIDVEVCMVYGPAYCLNCRWSEEEEVNKLYKEEKK